MQGRDNIIRVLGRISQHRTIILPAAARPSSRCLLMAGAWHLALGAGCPPRLDRPATISLRQGLTVGRGAAHVLLDSLEIPNLISRIHATFIMDQACGTPVVENHSINLVRLESRQGEGLKPAKNVAKGKRAQLTEGCTIIFGSQGSLTEFCYVLRRGEPAASTSGTSVGDETDDEDEIICSLSAPPRESSAAGAPAADLAAGGLPTHADGGEPPYEDGTGDRDAEPDEGDDTDVEDPEQPLAEGQEASAPAMADAPASHSKHPEATSRPEPLAVPAVVDDGDFAEVGHAAGRDTGSERQRGDGSPSAADVEGGRACAFTEGGRGTEAGEEAAPTAHESPRGAATSSEAPSPSAMSTQALREALRMRAVSFHGCVEKAEVTIPWTCLLP